MRGIRHEEERYVRLYTRDTVEWELLPWEARALYPLLRRKLDRAGIMELGKHGARGLAILVKLPVEVVEPGLAALLADGWLQLHGTTLLDPEFIEAEEAVACDAARQRASRERARDRARLTVLGVTPRDVEVTRRDESVTPRDESVTPGHAQSRPVTLSHSVPSVPCLAVPDHKDPPEQTRLVVLNGGPGTQESLLPADAARPTASRPKRSAKTNQKSEVTEQELVEIYERYPRKGGGRKEGLALLGNEIKTRTQLEELRRAVDYYAREQRNTEKTFIKTFANWAASWEDYAQPDLSSTAPPQANPAMDSVAVMMRKDAEWKNLTDEERAAAEKEAKTAFAAAKAVLK